MHTLHPAIESARCSEYIRYLGTGRWKKISFPLLRGRNSRKRVFLDRFVLADLVKLLCTGFGKFLRNRGCDAVIFSLAHNDRLRERKILSARRVPAQIQRVFARLSF